MDRLKEQWQKSIKENPYQVASKFAILVIILLTILLLIIGYSIKNDTQSSPMERIIAFGASISGLLVLVLSAVSFVFNYASLGQLKNEILGTHQIFDSFRAHLDFFLKKVTYRGHGKLKDMTLVVSSLAYGIQSDNSDNVRIFYNIINTFLDDIEKNADIDEPRALSLYLWEKESHRKLFAIDNETKDNSALICDELKTLLQRIKTVKKKFRKLFVTFHSTKKLDWRLFTYKKENESFGMTVLFTPLVDKNMLDEGNWKMSSYSSNSLGIESQLSNFLGTLDRDGTCDITSVVLDDIDFFIKEWFDVECSCITSP